MSELAVLITSIVGALGVIGGGIAWVWDRIEKRFAAVEQKLVECEERERKHTETAATHLLVIELLWQEVKRRSRGAPNETLIRAGEILDDLKDGKR